MEGESPEGTFPILVKSSEAVLADSVRKAWIIQQIRNKSQLIEMTKMKMTLPMTMGI
jgi:hypothetical protein